MPKSKKTSFIVRKIKAYAPSWVHRLMDTSLGRQQPQSQRNQPVNRQTQAAATPDTTHNLRSLEQALTRGTDAGVIHTAFTELSHAERQAHWQTGEPVSFADQLTIWEQNMEELLARYRTDPALSDGLALLRRTLRHTPHQPFDTVEVSAHALYRTFIQEGNGDVVRFAQQIANTNTREEISANQDLIERLAPMFGQLTATRVLPYIHRLKAEQAERQRASVLGTDLATGEEVIVTQLARQQGLYCIGVNGTGKTTLLTNLIKKDLELGHGLCLIEPHGDLTRTVLSLVPPQCLPDVILLDVMDCATFPFSLNLFQSDLTGDANEAAKIASFLMHLFEKVWNVGTETPRLQQVLRNITRTLLANPGMTFAEIPLLLWDDVAREKLVSNVTNTQTQLFWQQYNRKSPRERSELTDSTMNKVDAYLNEPMIANIVSQAQTTINFRRIMDESKILLINASPQLEEMSRLLGAVIIGRLLMAAFSRTDQLEDERRQFNLYVDEFQRVATSDWRTFLEEARKFKVAITMAHQSISQLDESLQTAATGAGTIVCFRVSGEDSRVLSTSYDATPTPEVVGQEPQRAVPIDVIGYLLRHGSPHPQAVSAFTQTYLFSLQEYLRKPRPASDPYFAASYDNYSGVLDLTETKMRQGYKRLNDSLYRCMTDQNPDIHIDPLALYVLAMAQGDGREYSFSYYIISKFGPINRMLKDFKEPTKRLGAPSFLNGQEQAYFRKQCPNPKKYRWTSEAVIQMIIDLRRCITALAKDPVLTDTGLYQPIYRQRTYADMTGEISNALSQQENYIARVKTLTTEHTIRTNPLPPLMSEAQLAERIRDIKTRMQEMELCRPAHAVEEEVRLRHERLRQRNNAPPPSHTNGSNRRRNRPRPPTQS
jgi:hypothetical protein